MINKIGVVFDKNHQQQNILYNNKQAKQPVNQNYSSVPCSLSLNYFVPFLGALSSDDKIKDPKMAKISDIMLYADAPTKKLIAYLKKEAAKDGFDSVTTLHVIKYSLMEIADYIDDLDKGKQSYSASGDNPVLANIIAETALANVFTEPDIRKKLKKLVNSSISNIDNFLNEHKTVSDGISSDKITFSEDLADAVWGNMDKKETIDVETFISGVINSPDDITSDFVDDFFDKVSDLSMKVTKPVSSRTPYSVYEKKAENVLKNLELGTNVYITYDSKKEIPQPFMDTVQKLINKNGKNYSVTELNDFATPEYFADVVASLAKDKSKEHIVIANPVNMIVLGGKQIEGTTSIIIPEELSKTLLNQPSNIKFLFYSTKDNYFAFCTGSDLFKDFNETSLPTLATQHMIQVFRENPVLMKTIGKSFSKNALEKTVMASAQLEGVFPVKTINLMKKVASYYSNKKEINETDVVNFLKEASYLFKKGNDDNSVEILFDTGKKLNDLVGKNSTKKEAASLVKQIKSNKMGTKGIIIYSQDGSPGSGRRYTSKAIAGEARVPYIEINTMDFGTKEVDIFGGGALSPEASIKKLFSIVTTQAEANPNKSAVLFIENFEYFSVGELVSLYHQKAMAQLLREMEKADKLGLNILVVGSVSNPDLIGEATLKSFKFVDSVEVSSPAYNKNERAEVIKKVLKDEKIKLDGTEEQKQKTIDAAANITNGFPFIFLKNLVKKTQSVAIERGHKNLTKADFIEAYLQITTGRPAINHIEEHEKQVVSSHECGHATNLEVMNHIAKTMGKPWHIPDKVNFITLDPRGIYGGAVYHGKDKNREMSFENIFASIVCSFGGNSAESRFFGMDGSLGISSDMEAVKYYADLMVKSFGMGANTGKIVVEPHEELSEDLKALVEKDERVIINNAKIVSDLITEIYSDFNKAFTLKYADRVGTGECLLDGDDFRHALNEWKLKQSPEKQKELKLCDEAIMKIMEATKKGIAVRKESD